MFSAPSSISAGLRSAASQVFRTWSLQAHRVGERVERERVLRRALDAEEVDLGAEAEDEVVVGQRLELAETHLARVEIDRRDRVLVDARVLLLVDEVANRMADRRLLEQAGRHLVQERLEGVVVVLVDEDDVDVAFFSFCAAPMPGEAAADDEDAGAPAVAVALCAHGVVPRYGRRRPPQSSKRDDRASGTANDRDELAERPLLDEVLASRSPVTWHANGCVRSLDLPDYWSPRLRLPRREG